MKTLYLFMSLGYPGSGKTYFTTRLAKEIGAVRINADALRMNVFGSFEAAREFDKETGKLAQVIFRALDYATVQILSSGNSVIYDVQQNEKAIREKNAGLGSDSGAVPIVLWVKTPIDIAMQRGQEREVTPDQQKHDFDTMKASIERNMRLIEPPDGGEKVIMIDGTVPFEQQYKSFCAQLDTL